MIPSAHLPDPGDDPTLTAFVLGESSPAERAAIEARLAADPTLRRQVAELRAAAELVRRALQSEWSTADRDCEDGPADAAGRTCRIVPVRDVVAEESRRAQSAPPSAGTSPRSSSPAVPRGRQRTMLACVVGVLVIGGYCLTPPATERSMGLVADNRWRRADNSRGLLDWEPRNGNGRFDEEWSLHYVETPGQPESKSVESLGEELELGLYLRERFQAPRDSRDRNALERPISALSAANRRGSEAAPSEDEAAARGLEHRFDGAAPEIDALDRPAVIHKVMADDLLGELKTLADQDGPQASDDLDEHRQAFWADNRSLSRAPLGARDSRLEQRVTNGPATTADAIDQAPGSNSPLVARWLSYYVQDPAFLGQPKSQSPEQLTEQRGNLQRLDAAEELAAGDRSDLRLRRAITNLLEAPGEPGRRLPSEMARDLATCGRYSDLLDKLEVPEDAPIYGPFCRYGYWGGRAYRGRVGLPPAHWVYVAPDWYLWGVDSGAPVERAPQAFAPPGSEPVRTTLEVLARESLDTSPDEPPPPPVATQRE